MSIKTNISWTDHTYNPWIGCTKLSPGCLHCYAQEDQERKKKRAGWGDGAPRVRTTTTDTDPLRWNRSAQLGGVRRRVFCSSLADVFDGHPSIQPAWKMDLWRTIRATPDLDWLLLTKRPELIRGDIERFNSGSLPPNVWLGFSAENQEYLDRRLAAMRDLNPAVKFVSCEPALGPIRLGAEHRGTLDWVIYGGETSTRRDVSRRADPQWARDLRDDCARLGIAFWFKQQGNWIGEKWRGKGAEVYKAEHDRLDDQIVHELPNSRSHSGSNSLEVNS